MYGPISKLSTALLAAALLGGCAASAPPPEPAAQPVSDTAPTPTLVGDVLGKTWEWVSWATPTGETMVETPARYTVEFDQDGLVFIQADCNRGQANYFLPAPGQIAIHGLSITRAACRAGSLSDRFVAAVEIARAWFMEDGNLMLEQPGTTGTMRFRRKP